MSIPAEVSDGTGRGSPDGYWQMSTDDMTGLQLGMATHCLQRALETCLLQLAAHHGNQAGAWLDALQQQILKDTENTDFQIPADIDADVTKAALLYVQSPFEHAREKLRSPRRP